MRTAWPIARPFSPMSLRASAPRAAAISPAIAWYSMLTSLCGLAPSIAVDALTPRYIVVIDAREPTGGALLNMSDSLLASRPCLSTRERKSLRRAQPRSVVVRVRRTRERVVRIELLRDVLGKGVGLRPRRI